jgi:hypothetical protein
MTQTTSENPPVLLSADGTHAWLSGRWTPLSPECVSPDRHWVLLDGQWRPAGVAITHMADEPNVASSQIAQPWMSDLPPNDGFDGRSAMEDSRSRPGSLAGPRPSRRPPSRKAIAVMAGVGILVAAGTIAFISSGSKSGSANLTTGSPVRATNGLTISGTQEVYSSDVESTDGTGCDLPSTSGYADISEGQQVNVYNETGALIATTNLGAGALGSDSSHCEFAFTFTGVPKAKFYSIETTSRGKLTFSAADVNTAGFSASMTLGDGS